MLCIGLENRRLSRSRNKNRHYYDDYFADDDGVIDRHNEEGHQKRKV